MVVVELYANREFQSYRDAWGLKDPNDQSPLSFCWRECRGKAITDGKGFGRLKTPQVGVTKWFHLGPHVSENSGSFSQCQKIPDRIMCKRKSVSRRRRSAWIIFKEISRLGPGTPGCYMDIVHYPKMKLQICHGPTHLPSMPAKLPTRIAMFKTGDDEIEYH